MKGLEDQCYYSVNFQSNFQQFIRYIVLRFFQLNPQILKLMVELRENSEPMHIID